MWIVKANLTYVDNGVIAETIAECINGPNEVPIPAPNPARRIFTSMEDAYEFINKEISVRLNPRTIETDFIADMEPPSDLNH